MSHGFTFYTGRVEKRRLFRVGEKRRPHFGSAERQHFRNPDASPKWAGAIKSRSTIVSAFEINKPPPPRLETSGARSATEYKYKRTLSYRISD